MYKSSFSLLNINYLIILIGDPLVGSIARQYLTQRREHDRTAQLWTHRYAN